MATTPLRIKGLTSAASLLAGYEFALDHSSLSTAKKATLTQLMGFIETNEFNDLLISSLNYNAEFLNNPTEKSVLSYLQKIIDKLLEQSDLITAIQNGAKTIFGSVADMQAAIADYDNGDIVIVDDSLNSIFATYIKQGGIWVYRNDVGTSTTSSGYRIEKVDTDKSSSTIEVDKSSGTTDYYPSNFNIGTQYTNAGSDFDFNQIIIKTGNNAGFDPTGYTYVCRITEFGEPEQTINNIVLTKNSENIINLPTARTVTSGATIRITIEDAISPETNPMNLIVNNAGDGTLLVNDTLVPGYSLYYQLINNVSGYNYVECTDAIIKVGGVLNLDEYTAERFIYIDVNKDVVTKTAEEFKALLGASSQLEKQSNIVHFRYNTINDAVSSYLENQTANNGAKFGLTLTGTSGKTFELTKAWFNYRDDLTEESTSPTIKIHRDRGGVITDMMATSGAVTINPGLNDMTANLDINSWQFGDILRLYVIVGTGTSTGSQIDSALHYEFTETV